MSGRLNSVAVRILKVRSGNVDLSLLQPVERQLTRCRRVNDFDAAESFHHAGQQACRRIAARQDDLVAHGLFLGEETKLCLARTRWRTRNDGIRFGKMIGPGIDGHAHPLRADAADPHGLPIAGSGLSQVFGSDRGGLFLPLPRKRKQFFDGDFKLARKLKRHFGVRHIGSGFDRVDGLPGYAHLSWRAPRRRRRGPSELWRDWFVRVPFTSSAALGVFKSS